MPVTCAGSVLISTDDDVVNFVNLFRPLAGQQAVEVFRFGRADVLHDMGKPLPGILPKIRKFEVLMALSACHRRLSLSSSLSMMFCSANVAIVEQKENLFSLPKRSNIDLPL